MEINNNRLAFLLVDLPNRPLGVRQRQKSKITAPASWPSHSAHPHRGHGDFNQCSLRLELHTVRETWRSRESIEIMADREDARIVEESLFRENFQGP